MAKKFTALSIAALKPQKNRYEISDVETGLCIRVTPAGSKTYIVRYKYLGKSCRLTLGRVEDISLTDARDLARVAIRKAHNGQNPAVEKQEVKQARIREERAKAEADLNLVDVALETYIELHVKSLKSKHEVERMLRKDVIPVWKGQDINAITKAHILDLIRPIKKKGHHAHANRVFANVRAFFNWAVHNDYGGLQFSPCTGLKMPEKENKRDRVLSDEEIRLMLLASDKMDEPWGDYFKLLFFTGVRRSEASAAQWSEFKLGDEKNEWIISGARTKNKRTLILPLPIAAVDMIKGIKRIDKCDYLFSVTGNSSVIGFSDAKERLEAHIQNIMVEENKKAGCSNRNEFKEGWRLHDIRRTVATGMASLGVAPHIVEAMLNHVSGTMAGVAGVYNRHGYYDEKKHALAIWANHLGDIKNGKFK